MIKSEHYKGIDFIRLSKLPEDQLAQISSWCKSHKIAILVNDQLWSDCLQYKDYSYWYENLYQPGKVIHENIDEVIARKRKKPRKIRGVFNALNFVKALVS